MQPEAAVREALRARVLAEASEVQQAVPEFWVPRSHERADLAVIGQSMDAFEIKTEHDTLRRLPRQALAYARVFDRCTAVVAEKHREPALEMLPRWWGVTTVRTNGSVVFNELRRRDFNPEVDPDTLVRLLWRDEAVTALAGLGREPDTRASRGSLWNELLRLPVAELKNIVRRAILHRDPSRARIPTRRFTIGPAAAAAPP